MFSKRNVSNNLRLAILLVLSAGIILSFATGALANGVFETWAGNLTVQVKATELDAGKFKTKSNSVQGTFELYTGVEGPPIPNGEGDYMKFISNDQLTIISIKQLALIDMDLNPGNVKFLGVGTGVFHDGNAPDPSNQDGIVYLDFTGSYKAAAGKKPEIISLVIKMGGGIDRDVVFSCNPKVNLYKQQPTD